MQDIHSTLRNLKRPRLLVRAARIGVEEYRRDVHLPRALRHPRVPRPAQAVMQLLDLEVELDTMRRTENAMYSVTRHIDVLVALMSEARFLRKAACTPVN